MIPARAIGGSVGTVRDVAISYGGHDSVDVTFSVDSLFPENLLAGLVIDGELVATAPATVGRVSAAGLRQSLHSIEIHLINAAAAWPDFHGADAGHRAWIEWTPSSDAVAYRVYRGSTLVGTVDQIQIEQRFMDGAKGRLSIFGEYQGPKPFNQQLAITFADGVFNWSLGLYSGSFAHNQGLTATLPYGIMIKIEDDLAWYSNGTTWHSQIGPQARFLTDPTEPGTYSFSVSSVNAVGTESERSVVRTVTIPDVPMAIDARQDFTTPNQIRYTWTNPQTYSAIRVYANYDPITNSYDDHVCTEVPTYTLAGTATSFTIQNPPTGTLRFYLCPVTGVERPDTDLYSTSYPPTPVDAGIVLGVPSNVSATPIANGAVVVEWDYRFRDNDAITSFEVLWSVDAETISEHAVIVNESTGVGFPVSHYSLVVEPETDTFVAGIIAHSTSYQSETVLSDPVVPDSSVPTVPTGVLILPQ